MAQLDIQKVDKSGDALTYDAAASGGDTFNAFDGVFVHAKNADASTREITIAAVVDPLVTQKAGSLDVPDIVVTVPVTGDVLFSIPPAYISSGGIASMTYDDETQLTIAVLNVAQ